MRKALPILRDLIEEYSVTIAVLPTGYGKSRFFQYNIDLMDRLGKVIHVLPLRAIVSELTTDLGEILGDEVGYQAGVYIEGAHKTPFLTTKYTIATLDSFFMNFYGIPISELWRSVWHSDVAFLLSRTSHIILDEIHLVITPDEIDKVEEEYAKVFQVIRDLIRWNFEAGLKTIILTATLYPWIIKYILPNEVLKNTSILIYAPESHVYLYNVKKILGNSMNIKSIWDERDEFYLTFKHYVENIPTYLHYKSMDEVLSDLLNYYLGDRIAIMFNSIRRCIRTYEKYYKQFEDQGYEVAILHGQMTPYAREKYLKIVKESSKTILFSTQVIEAGVNIDLNAVITEVAPPHALIQRIGRVARYRIYEGVPYSIHIVIGGGDPMAGVQELCKGIYDIELTSKIIRYLEQYAEEADDSSRRLTINWRLPQTSDVLDYLKILTIAEEPLQLPYAGDVSNMLNELTVWRARSRMLRELDELLQGSFVRSSALIPIYLGSTVDEIKDAGQIDELLNKYTITTDIRFLRRHGNEILELKENGGRKYVKVVAIIDDRELRIFEGGDLSGILKHPLYTLHKTISMIRKRYEEYEGIFPRIFILGLKASPNIKFNAEKGYLSW
jgi:CRISPR-associated helicase Cas3